MARRNRVWMLLLGLLLAACNLSPTAETSPRALIADVTTDKAMYAPGDSVVIEVRLQNQSASIYRGMLSLSYEQLGETLGEPQTQLVEALAVGESATLTFRWTPPTSDFQGYRVAVQALDQSGKTTLDQAATAIDVSSDWKKFPRYGFVSRFNSNVDPAEVIAQLNAYHINGLQFYDWQWQHHRPFSPDQSWPDIANRPIARDTVTALITQAHQRNMVAMNYNLAYGAYDGYWQDGSGVQIAWGLFTGQGEPSPEIQDYHPLPDGWATRKIFLMNPADADWQQYLFAQEQQVFDHFAFDGWHIDTLGKRSALRDASQQIVNMPKALTAFTEQASAALGKRMILNTISGYGQNEIAASDAVDLIYSEVWESDGIQTYNDLLKLVTRAQAKSDKAVVIPAYMNRLYGQETPSGTTRFFREPSVRLTNAVLFAAGAAHLELGDGNGMLSNEYFPYQPLVMSDTLTSAMRDSYDFSVAYENLLRDQVSASELSIQLDSDYPSSSNGKPGTIWTLARSKPGYTIAHLINLSQNRLSLWRDDGAVYPAPETLTNLDMKLYYTGSLSADAALWYASPDQAHGAASRLRYTTSSDSQGTFVAFTLPALQYWDMVWLAQ